MAPETLCGGGQSTIAPAHSTGWVRWFLATPSRECEQALDKSNGSLRGRGLQGLQHQFHAAGSSGLVKDFVDVFLDGVFRNPNSRRNLPIGHALDYKRSHFLLSGRKESGNAVRLLRHGNHV